MTAAAIVLAAVKSLGHPIEAQAFLAAITEGEGGDLPGRLYGGGTLREPNNPNVGTDAKGRIWKGSLDAFPDWGGAWLSNNGGGDYSTAAGVLQFTGTTWRRVSPITGRASFSIEDQLKNGWWLASDDFLRNSRMDLLGALQAGMLAVIPTYLVRTWPGGASSSFPRRYAANLAALQAPPAPPPAPPAPEHTIVTLSVAGQDQHGNPVTFVLKSAAMAMPVLAGLGIGGMLACAPTRPAPQQIAEKTSLEPVQAPESKPGSIWDLSTFKLVPGPLGPLAVPLGK